MPSYESSMRNLARARAVWRPPRPWRSSDEARMIRDMCSSGSQPAAKSPRVGIGLGNSASAIRGFRNSFGVFRPARSKCIGKRDVAAILTSRNSSAPESAHNG